MSRREPTVLCRECGREAAGRLNVQLCNSCRLRKLHAPRNCDQCGEYRRHVAKGLCPTCHRLSRLRTDTCSRCGETRQIEQGRQQCRRCWTQVNARSGACADCQRSVQRLYGGRCRPCQRRAHIPTHKPCQDCGEVDELTRGRCRGCYYYFQRHPMGTCGACNQQFPIGPSGLCRGCFNNRRARHIINDPIGRVLLEQLTHYAQARGWADDTVSEVRTSLRMVLDNPESLGPTPWTSAAIEQLLLTTGSHRSGKGILRVIEFLIDEGRATPSTELTFERWISTQFHDFKPHIVAELTNWIDVMRGNGPRPRKPLQNNTIRSYVWILQGPLASWSQSYESLREVTTDAVDEQIRTFTGSERSLAATAMRSLFRTLKAKRIIFANPTTHLIRQNCPPGAPVGLQPDQRARLLSGAQRRDEELMILLAGVHALRIGQIARLRVDDVELASRTIKVDGTIRYLDTLTVQHLTAWLRHRRQRWPETANPHLLINAHTANGTDAIHTGHITKTFRRLGHTAHQLRVDRFLDEVHNGNADPIQLARLFGISDPTALYYCSATALLEQSGAIPARPNGSLTTHEAAKDTGRRRK